MHSLDGLQGNQKIIIAVGVFFFIVGPILTALRKRKGSCAAEALLGMVLLGGVIYSSGPQRYTHVPEVAVPEVLLGWRPSLLGWRAERPLKHVSISQVYKIYNSRCHERDLARYDNLSDALLNLSCAEDMLQICSSVCIKTSSKSLRPSVLWYCSTCVALSALISISAAIYSFLAFIAILHVKGVIIEWNHVNFTMDVSSCVPTSLKDLDSFSPCSVVPLGFQAGPHHSKHSFRHRASFRYSAAAGEAAQVEFFVLKRRPQAGIILTTRRIFQVTKTPRFWGLFGCARSTSTRVESCSHAAVHAVCARPTEPLIKMDVLVHNCSIFYAQLMMEAAVACLESIYKYDLKIDTAIIKNYHMVYIA